MNINERNTIIEEHYRNNYNSLVKRMTFRVGGYSTELAEEVVQEAYARALKYFKRFSRDKGVFEQWFSIVLNNTLNQIKNSERNKGAVLELDAVQDYETLPEGISVNQRDISLVMIGDLINQERLRNRTILSLYFFDGFKTREIADFLNLNHNNVRQIINRFREGLVAVPEGVS